MSIENKQKFQQNVFLKPHGAFFFFFTEMTLETRLTHRLFGFSPTRLRWRRRQRWGEKKIKKAGEQLGSHQDTRTHRARLIRNNRRCTNNSTAPHRGRRPIFYFLSLFPLQASSSRLDSQPSLPLHLIRKKKKKTQFDSAACIKAKLEIIIIIILWPRIAQLPDSTSCLVAHV